ncbi:MAG TPA: serine hydrolase [Thermoanaerobaculia bacterium]
MTNTRSIHKATALVILGALLVSQRSFPQPQDFPHKYVDYTIETKNAVQPFAKVDAKAAGIDPAALERLVKRAEETHSDALVILKDGKLVGDWRFGKPAEPIEVMSVSKSVASLAVGNLLYKGKIRSLDELVSTYLPEWREGPKKAVTLRHLLNHTSGLQANPNAQEVYESKDIVKLALDAGLVKEPGTEFFYNNKAVNLLGAIVEKASGKKLDEYMRDEVFAPLGITRFSWMRDAAGNPHVMAGAKLDALDLAKLGQLMLDGGVYQGRRIVSAEWAREAVTAAQSLNPTGGLLWWVVPEWEKRRFDDELFETWRQGGADPAFLEKMETFRGKELEMETFLGEMERIFGAGQGMPAYMMNIRAKGLRGPKTLVGPTLGFNANGYLGQFIVALTGPRLVVVRQIRQESFQSEADGFAEITKLARELAPKG